LLLIFLLFSVLEGLGIEAGIFWDEDGIQVVEVFQRGGIKGKQGKDQNEKCAAAAVVVAGVIVGLVSWTKNAKRKAMAKTAGEDFMDVEL